MKRYVSTFAGLLAAALLSTTANAGTIIGAQSAVINEGGPGFGSINDTFNQAGLSAGYTGGVTDFASYIASKPTHTVTFGGFEWFSNTGLDTASVTYDLGKLYNLSALALWNEESSGIGLLALFGSSDGNTFSSIGSFSPADNPDNAPYLAQVFNITSTQSRYVRFDMSGCPQQPSAFVACAIGEVAFDATAANAVPEPSTWAMMLVGFGMVGAGMRYQRRSNKVAFG